MTTPTPHDLPVSINRLVSYNVARSRKERGWSQAHLAQRLSDNTALGGDGQSAAWTEASVSAAERAVKGQRVKSWSANELVALAHTFERPIGWFFLPPESASDRPFGTEASADLFTTVDRVPVKASTGFARGAFHRFDRRNLIAAIDPVNKPATYRERIEREQRALADEEGQS